MNICFLIGEIISDVEFDFVINNNKGFKNEKISVVRFKLKLLDENVVNIIGYNNIAEFCYQKLNMGNYIFIEGYINTFGVVEIKNIKII